MPVPCPSDISPTLAMRRFAGCAALLLFWAGEASAQPPTNQEPGSPSPDSSSATSYNQPPVTTYPNNTEAVAPEVATRPLLDDAQVVPPAWSPGAQSAALGESPEAATRLVGIDAQQGVFMRSEDGRLSLNVGMFLQVRATASTTPDVSRRYEAVPVVARVFLQGNAAVPWVRYFLQTEFAGQQNPFPVAPVPEAPRLLDAWLEAQPTPSFGVRFGMMRPAFTRSWMGALNKMILFDRSEANAFFRTHGPLLRASLPGTVATVPWDRDIGLQVSGAPGDGAVEYALGVFNGNGSLLGRNGDQHVMPAARLAFNPLGKVSPDETTSTSDPRSPLRMQLGVGAYQNRYAVQYAEDGEPSELGSEEQKTLGLDFTAYGSGVHFSAEGYLRWRRDINLLRHRERGAKATFGWMFWAPHLELAARYSIVDPHVGVDGDLRQVYDAQVNWYVWENHLKFALRYSHARDQAAFEGGAPEQPISIAADTVVQSGSLLSQVSF